MSNQTEPIIKIDMPLSAVKVLQKALALANSHTLWSMESADAKQFQQICADIDRILESH